MDEQKVFIMGMFFDRGRERESEQTLKYIKHNLHHLPSTIHLARLLASPCHGLSHFSL